eukprot:TRINITY_DN2163_c0_g1_i2.p1 TRINITY_DN2163_c0_g1~~TRINITY_DN2163_c0_g1_i2.p1  ORF type:complete len:174 (-),score=87.11 TRINITY_DN2163_c0_g1_i2:162-617(-)
MNAEKLKKLQAEVRIGGKGTPRRKKKAVHKANAGDDKRIQQTLKKLNLNPIPGIEEVNIIKDDGTVIQFHGPKVSASINANTYVISGQSETKKIGDILPNLFQDLGPEHLANLKKLAESMGKEGQAPAATTTTGDDDVPELVENFDAAATK